VKVLVTGGAGFIGSHVVDLLLAGGADVVVLDSLDPSVHAVPPEIDPRVDLRVASVTEPGAVAKALSGVDAVCHQAARVGLGVDFGDVNGYVAANDVGTAVLLEALWRKGFSGRLVLAGSMVVYGDGLARCTVHGVVVPSARRDADLAAGSWEPRCPVGAGAGGIDAGRIDAGAACHAPLRWVPVDESAPTDPRNVYAATKLHQEHLCWLWGRAAGATVVALRYHNVYGPRMPRDTPYAGVASIFRSALAAGGPAVVFEDGGQTRDFVHVRDVARANVLALTADVPSGAYNVASGRPRTVLDMAVALTDAFGPDAPRPEVRGGWRRGDVRHIVASPRRAADVLGFTAETGFEDGMAEFAHAPQRAAAVS
jgi:dTDP-L-rhamnose 4-epimerase